MASIGAFPPPSNRNIIQVARKLSGDCWGWLQSMASSNLQLQDYFTIFVYYCLSQCVYLTALPPHKEANLPSNSKFLLLCCYIRTVIGITAFSVSELEHLCTLLDAGRPRGKNLKIWDFCTSIRSRADYNTEYHTQRSTSYPLVDLLMKKP